MNSNLTPSPNVALLDAMQRIWSLKTVDDGSGNQEIVVSSAPAALNGSQVAIQPLLGTKAYQVTATASGATIVVPASAGLRFFISAIKVSLLAGSTLGAAGDLTVNILDGATVMLSDQVYVPAAGITVEGSDLTYALSNLNYISGAVNQALNVNLSATLTAGGISVTVFGGYTTQTP